MSDRPRPSGGDGNAPDLEVPLRDLLADRGRTTNGDVRALLDDVALLPDRSATRQGSLLAAAAAVGLLVVGAALVIPRLSPTGVGADEPRVGRAAWASDPRLAACEATTGPAAQVFEMTHAEWFPLYFPGWWQGAPELEVSDPALVVIGPPFPGGLLGAAPNASDPSPAPTRPPSFLMCVAVGEPGQAVLHQYGPTWFERIVPVLSDADVARAAHLDPDVLGDPATWPFPERLAPCGGLTSNVQFVFEAKLLDFPRYFPSAEPIPALNVDEPGVVVVYRDPLPDLRRSAASRAGQPGIHDVCVIRENGAPPVPMILPEVDTHGFHLRIDLDEAGQSAEPSPPATPAPQNLITPEPAPAWAGDTISMLDCDGSKRDAGLNRGDSGSAANPDDALANVIATARYLDVAIPIDEYVVAADDPAARLFLREDHGRTIAAIAIVAATPGSTTSWVLGSASMCDAAEFDPSVPTGIDPIGTWFDEAGAPVAKSVLSGRDDCYGGTQVTLDGRLFVRIPKGGVDPAQLETSWKPDIALPSTAIDTGYRSGELRLYRSAQGGAIYVVNGDRAERLPHVIGDEVVRTDCN